MKTDRSITRCAAVVLASLLLCATASAAAPAPCQVRLTVELTPDVPEPADAGFLGSLLSNQVNYRLTLRHERSQSSSGSPSGSVGKTDTLDEMRGRIWSPEMNRFNSGW